MIIEFGTPNTSSFIKVSNMHDVKDVAELVLNVQVNQQNVVTQISQLQADLDTASDAMLDAYQDSDQGWKMANKYIGENLDLQANFDILGEDLDAIIANHDEEIDDWYDDKNAYESQIDDLREENENLTDELIGTESLLEEFRNEYQRQQAKLKEFYVAIGDMKVSDLVDTKFVTEPEVIEVELS